MKRIAAVGCLLFLFALSPMLRAGKVIKVTEKDLVEGKVEYITIYLNKNQVRVDTKGEDQNFSAIYSATDDRFVMINHSRKAYAVLTREDVDQMARQMKSTMDQVMAQMQEQLKNLPPEQRQMAEEMMKKQMPGQNAEEEAASKKEYKKIASGVLVGQWKTAHYEVYQDDVKEEEVWTVSPDKVGIQEDDFSVFMKMQKFFEAMVPAGERGKASQGFLSGEEFKTYGLPIKTVSFDRGKATSESVVQSIEDRSLTNALFQPPVGYKKTSGFMELMMQ
ncbi:MAG: hypothetical protein D6715_12290 [Calditrichaeota bacterium]|nr:MAG: hypothetical protein D6715_12290 [Calditrichota bacterium]